MKYRSDGSEDRHFHPAEVGGASAYSGLEVRGKTCCAFSLPQADDPQAKRA